MSDTSWRELALQFDAQQTLDVLAADEIQEMEAREKIDRKRKALEKLDRIDPQLRKDLGL